MLAIFVGGCAHPVKLEQLDKDSRYVTFQLTEVAVSKILFQKILALIDDLRRKPVPA
jgi:hypothetical protein